MPDTKKDNVHTLRKEVDDEKARLDAEQAALDADGGKSIEDIEKAGLVEEEGDGQFAFEVPAGPGGKALTWKDLVPRNVPVEHRVMMSGKSIPNPKGGLLDPKDTNGLLLVSYVVDNYKPQYVRDANGAIEKVVIYAVIKPKHVVNARSEAGDVLLHGEPQAA